MTNIASLASCMVISSQKAACPVSPMLIEDHPSTHTCQTSLRSMP